MFCEGTKNIVTNQMHARIPNTMVVRERWVNLCIDVNSFIRDCFSKSGAPYGTPVIAPSQAMSAGTSRPVGGGSGDMAALHSSKNNEISGTQLKQAATALAKQSQQSAAALNQNNMKAIEVIHLEGSFKVRKIFTSRSLIPADSVFDSVQIGTMGSGMATAKSGGPLRTEDIINAAMSG